MEYLVSCSCGRTTALKMSQAKRDRMVAGKENIQDIFPDKDPFYREALISGMCYDCQSRIFHRPKPGENWGAVVAVCECCGANVYAKDAAVCAVCHEPLGAPEECNDGIPV